MIFMVGHVYLPHGFTWEICLYKWVIYISMRVNDMAEVTLKDLLEAGAHFGHPARRWNPAMTKYIFAQRDGVHIFDLVKTKDGLDRARELLSEVAGPGGPVL